MPDQTLNLTLPYILASQADKHVTFNAAMDIVDTIGQLSVASRMLSAPPATPPLGESWIIGPAPTAEWAGHVNEVATWLATGWQFLVPKAGWRAWVKAENIELVFASGAWSIAIGQAPVPKLGIKTPADATNVLAVSGPATLFTADTSNHLIKINKASSAASGTMAFQTAYSTRAEIGLAGNDKLTIKVSANGSSFVEAIVVDQTSGSVGMGTNTPSAPLHVTGAVRVGQYAKASLPSATTLGAGATIYVTDEVGGPVLAFSDGTAWRRVTDRLVVA
jgi:hypothetical protein